MFLIIEPILMPQFLYIFLGSIPFFVGAATNFIGDLRDLAKTSKVGRSTFQFLLINITKSLYLKTLVFIDEIGGFLEVSSFGWSKNTTHVLVSSLRHVTLQATKFQAHDSRLVTVPLAPWNQAFGLHSKALSAMQIAGASLTILGGVAYGKARQAIEEEASGVGGWGMDGGRWFP